MSGNAALAFEAIINAMWYLATSWRLPALNFTPAQLFFFIMFVRLLIPWVKDMLSVEVRDNGGRKGDN